MVCHATETFVSGFCRVGSFQSRARTCSILECQREQTRPATMRKARRGCICGWLALACIKGADVMQVFGRDLREAFASSFVHQRSRDRRVKRSGHDRANRKEDQPREASDMRWKQHYHYSVHLWVSLKWEAQASRFASALCNRRSSSTWWLSCLPSAWKPSYGRLLSNLPTSDVSSTASESCVRTRSVLEDEDVEVD